MCVEILFPNATVLAMSDVQGTFNVTGSDGKHLTFVQGYLSTVEPLNNGQVGDEHFVHCSDVVPSSEVEMYG